MHSLGIITGRYYCLNTNHFERYIPCADPPPRKVLAKLLSTIMYDFKSNCGEELDRMIKRTAKLIRKKKPQIEWQIMLLS